jgi:hypothetical protein
VGARRHQWTRALKAQQSSNVLHEIFREITFAQQELKQRGTHHDAALRWVGWTVAGGTADSGGFGRGRVWNVCRPFGFAFFGHVLTKGKYSVWGILFSVFLFT